ncbi:hypothetical protein E1B28_008987 [Marasmius oreades]|uniref:Uncharacterized protein n=1 Tax=Marasmius oreades TaxID=181124 RepID=A0A9P7S056_9AGAR|nr:uncharacterized protein E1B28_008987 [Marasmius oreades]KAG7092650.1 hypothetical protein E1B28_008987 [Marasmius oreades]
MPSPSLPGTGETSYSSTCDAPASQWDLYRNSLHNDPCQVAEGLLSDKNCVTNDNITETNSALRNILETQEAKDAIPDQFNRCLCSSPVYALVAFCRSCQSPSSFNSSIPVFASWAGWSSNCNVTLNRQNFVVFPFNDILEHDHVMKWTNDTGNFDENGNFSLRRTKRSVEEGDRSEFGPPMSTTIPSTNEEPPSRAGNGTNDTGNRQTLSSSSKPPVGPIVGGVIGGVAFLALLASLLLWYFRFRRREKKEAPSTTYIRACGGRLSANMHLTTPYVAGNRESVIQYPNEKAILAERENMETPVRINSTPETTNSESFDPYNISEINRLQTAQLGDTGSRG